jgi:TolB protein
MPDGEKVLYASTHLGNEACPLSPCKNESALQEDPILKELCKSSYIWDIFPDFDIFVANSDSAIEKRLTDSPGYDAEATVSPNGDRIVFTSIRSGDLELWTMKLDGTDLKQVTNELGYDGGAFFSPDGKRLVFRASRPTGVDVEKYKVKIF